MVWQAAPDASPVSTLVLFHVKITSRDDCTVEAIACCGDSPI